jgi:hypothetical protein
LLGAKGLEVEGNYRTAKMPPVNHGLLDVQLAWRLHDGGHTHAPSMKWFIQWADKFIGHPNARRFRHKPTRGGAPPPRKYFRNLNETTLTCIYISSKPNTN